MFTKFEESLVNLIRLPVVESSIRMFTIDLVESLECASIKADAI